jgi:hypothetical protein
VTGPLEHVWLHRAVWEGLHPSKALEAARFSDRVDENHIFGALEGFLELLGGAKRGGPHAFPVTYVKVVRLYAFHYEIASWREEVWTFVNVFLELEDSFWADIILLLLLYKVTRRPPRLRSLIRIAIRPSIRSLHKSLWSLLWMFVRGHSRRRRRSLVRRRRRLLLPPHHLPVLLIVLPAAGRRQSLLVLMAASRRPSPCQRAILISLRRDRQRRCD